MIHHLLSSGRTLIMGVLNVTPDSFSDGGQFFSFEKAVERAMEMVEEGADIIDIGGESSRPGADPVSLEEEAQRVLPVVEKLLSIIDVPISVDTYKGSIASQVLEMGVEIINDITGLRYDRNMANIIARLEAYVIIMHMKGTPRDMQLDPHYNDLMGELIEFFKDRVDYARSNGIEETRIILDPGIGFGKNVNDNFIILNSLQRIVDMGYPVLVGPSRKTFIGKTLNLPVDERIEGTASTVTAAILNGARVVRVHDVKEMKRVVTITDTIVTEGVAI